MDYYDDEYKQLVLQGQTYISRNWLRFNTATREFCQRTYTEHGSRKQDDVDPFGSFENTEYSLGLISRCANHSLDQARKDGIIPGECSDQVIEEIVNVINDKVLSKEKTIVQLCLIALRKNQIAWLSWRVGPENKKFSGPKAVMKLLFGMFFGISIPAIAAYVIWAQIHGTDMQAVFAAYFGWVAWSIYSWLKNMPLVSTDKQALNAWESMIGSSNAWLFTGRAALEKFRDMQRKDLPVPLLSFELAHLLMGAHE